MPRAVIPRNRPIERILASFNARIRRLEVNRDSKLQCGTALFTVAGSASYATSWTPDWTTATKEQDTIGCSLASGGIILPPQWFFCAHVVWTINAEAPPPTGEFMQWTALQDGTFSAADNTPLGELRYDPLFDSSGSNPAQTFGATVIGATGTWSNGGVFMGVATTTLGTTFKPYEAAIAITGEQLYAPGFPHATVGT